jgi:hypothetical protein
MIKTLSLMLSLILFHLLLVNFSILPGNIASMIYVDLSIFFIFIVGILVTFPGIKKGGENFSIRFLLITTIQMLSMLSIILVLAFKKIEGVKVLGFSAIILFISLLAIQSFVLIRAMNKK